MAVWTVLVVDDNALIRRLLCELFTRQQLQIWKQRPRPQPREHG
jgi:CheY-like chemotaxis protein